MGVWVVRDTYMLEKRFAAVPIQVFTANGGVDGSITIADTSLFKVKQRVTISATGQVNQELEIKKIISSTALVLGPTTGSIFTFTDLSAYTVASGANLFAIEQKRPTITADDFERAVYEEEPTVAKRMILVDEFGNRITQSNPLPTSATFSGGITVGSVDQGAPNTAANAWPVKPTDGVNSQAYLAGGEAKVSLTQPLPAGTNLLGSVELKPASANTVTTVASSITNVTILAANPNRLGATVYNDSTSIFYLKLGATASTTSYTVQMGSKTYYELPYGWTGQIDGVWASANGSARVGEFT